MFSLYLRKYFLTIVKYFKLVFSPLPGSNRKKKPLEFIKFTLTRKYVQYKKIAVSSVSTVSSASSINAVSSVSSLAKRLAHVSLAWSRKTQDYKADCEVNSLRGDRRG